MFSPQIYSSWKETQEQKYKAILQFFPEVFYGLVLDIGSGKGYLEEFLSGKIDANIVGIDVEKPSSILASGSELPFKDNSFDRIVCIDSMHLISSNDFHRVLKKGGLALISIFFNQENFNEKDKLVEDKLSGFKIISSKIADGKESEYMVLAKKT